MSIHTLTQNNVLPDMNIYKPSGKGTLITDLIKKNNNNCNNDDNSTHSDSNDNHNDIKKLANDVNISLQELEKSEKNRKKIEYKIIPDSYHINDSNDDTISVETVEYSNHYVETFIEIILLLTIYVILSQPFVVSFISKYVNPVNPSDNGHVRLTGLIIYGSILTLTFIVSRNILLTKIKQS